MHWAYRPLRAQAAPGVADSAWPRGIVDAFLLAAMEARGLRPAGDAEPAALCRRIHFVLTGLPPRPEDLDAFCRDAEPDARVRLVDRLLGSPAFGERWGRHWLDVARFGESVTLRGFVYPHAWRYREYVLDAFNRDLPFDEFAREQIAGDLIGGETLVERQRRLAATTFLALGNTNLEEQDKTQLELDVIDEQLDVIAKAFLAQTVTCARCHDHKFDPISTREYYALAGTLRGVKAIEHANVSRWIETPLPLPPEEEAVLRAWEEEAADLRARIEQLEKEAAELALSTGRPAAGASLKELPGIVIDDAQAKAVGMWTRSQSVRPYLGDGYAHDGASDKGAKTLTFHPEIRRAGSYEVRVAYTAAPNRSAAVPVTVFSAGGESTHRIDEQRPPPVDGHFVSLGAFHFEANGAGFVLVSTDGTTGHVVIDAVQLLPVEEDVPAAAPGAPPASPAAGTAALAALRQEIAAAQARLKVAAASVDTRPRVMTVQEERPRDMPVLLRGDHRTPAEIAPRGFLGVLPLPATPASWTPGESGRRELAAWIVSPDNPLWPRVIVNRVWHWVFGAGLVRSTDNFGTTGEAPSHPELLERLSADFLKRSASVKAIVRELVLSRAFAQSVACDPALVESDPDNRWLARSHRRRLEAECIRDAMLAAAGELVHTIPRRPTFPAGLAADFGFAGASSLRSVYLPAFRNARHEVFRAFDAADPTVVTGARQRTTVAAQALFFLNDPLVEHLAAHAARRLLREPAPGAAARVEQLYKRLTGRSPTPAEARAALDHAGLPPPGEEERRWAEVVKAVFASLDFRFLD